MSSVSCPKCNKKSEDVNECTHCGTVFAEYQKLKQEKLGEVRQLLSENKFREAKELADKLPLQFPDNRNDFLLLLSNITRDISIVDKCDLAQKACDDGDYTQASVLLRNIKAFDHNLNERVISLRRKIERYSHNDANFTRGVEAFDKGNYVAAKELFRAIIGYKGQQEVLEYLQKIDAEKKAMFADILECVKMKQLDIAENKLKILKTVFPETEEEVASYSTFIAQRIEIRNNIFDAARKAKKEKRLLEAKVLYHYLGWQFPEILPRIQPHLLEIGSEAIVSYADIHDSGIVDVAALGLDPNSDGFSSIDSMGTPAQAENMADLSSHDVSDVKTLPVSAGAVNNSAIGDILSRPVQVISNGVADFTF